MICYLSYPIADSIPVYGGQANLNLRQVKNIAQGDTCNVWRFCLENHWGTHVDCPSHFFEEGKKVTDYPPDFWRFRNPQVIKVEAEPGRIFSREDITCDLQSETDMILFQSGFRMGKDKRQ